MCTGTLQNTLTIMYRKSTIRSRVHHLVYVHVLHSDPMDMVYRNPMAMKPPNFDLMYRNPVGGLGSCRTQPEVSLGHRHLTHVADR